MSPFENKREIESGNAKDKREKGSGSAKRKIESGNVKDKRKIMVTPREENTNKKELVSLAQNNNSKFRYQYQY